MTEKQCQLVEEEQCDLVDEERCITVPDQVSYILYLQGVRNISVSSFLSLSRDTTIKSPQLTSDDFRIATWSTRSCATP